MAALFTSIYCKFITIRFVRTVWYLRESLAYWLQILILGQPYSVKREGASTERRMELVSNLNIRYGRQRFHVYAPVDCDLLAAWKIYWFNSWSSLEHPLWLWCFRHAHRPLQHHLIRFQIQFKQFRKSYWCGASFWTIKAYVFKM